MRSQFLIADCFGKMISFGHKKQNGSSLYISVMILFLVALSGLTIFASSLTNQKISANYMHKNISYQAVENVFASLLSETRNQWQAKIPAAKTANTLTGTVTNNTPGVETTMTMTYLKSAIPNASQVPDGFPLNDLVGNYYQVDISGQYAKANSTHRMTVVAFSPTGASGAGQDNTVLVED